MIFKNKKGNLTLTILMWVVVGVLLSFAIINATKKITDNSTINHIYLARDIGASILTVSTFPEEIGVRYQFIYDYNNLFLSNKENTIFIYNYLSSDKEASSKFSGYTLTIPEETVVIYKKEDLNLASFLLLKYKNVIYVSDEVTDKGFTNKVDYSDLFKDGKYLFLEIIDNNLKEFETYFKTELKDIKKANSNKDAKINLILKYSSDDTTKISYSVENKNYLEEISNNLFLELKKINAYEQKLIFNVYLPSENSFKETYGENVILIELQKKYDSNENDVKSVISTMAMYFAEYFNKI